MHGEGHVELQHRVIVRRSILFAALGSDLKLSDHYWNPLVLDSRLQLCIDSLQLATTEELYNMAFAKVTTMCAAVVLMPEYGSFGI